jgi:glycosyltransferase involved in cell wall biosynthesis
MKKNLIIINNEKCSKVNNQFFCENIEISSITYSFSKFFEVNLIARKSPLKGIHKIKIKNIFLFSKFLKFSLFLFKKLILKKKEDRIFLLISITPFTFFSYLFLIFISKKIFLYLRSNGQKEFEYILGKKYVWIYSFCLYLMSIKAKLIVVNKDITNNKHKLVLPSQLNKIWFKKRIINNQKIHRVKILYLGRIKKEKGVYSLINLYKKLNINFSHSLTLVGSGDCIVNLNNKIKIKKPLSNISKIINLIDSHEITILPSYTEGHPQVLIESLARLRPVIIFEEIKNVKKNYRGVFVIKRNVSSLENIITKIKYNYPNIQHDIKRNNLPTHNNFVNNFVNILKK